MTPQPAPPPSHAHDFVRELLSIGCTLIDVLGEVVDGCERSDAFDDEEPAQAVIEMAAGSVAVHLRKVPPGDFVRAIELMGLATDAILADLRMASEIAGRRENGTP